MTFVRRGLLPVLQRCTNSVRQVPILRAFSTKHIPERLPNIDHIELTVTTTDTPKTKLPENELKFGHTFTDHMFEVDWNEDEGWHSPRVVPYGPLAVDPAASSLHYALQCFEGMKAYRDANDPDQLRLFRPLENFKRMNRSNERLFFPSFDGDELLECLKSLLNTDADWVPYGDGNSLYIRPTCISMQPTLGVGPAAHVKLYIICSPVGPYYPSGFKAVELYADASYVRAWPGGTGDAKVGGNYGPTIYPQSEAAKKGYAQIMWLFGEDHQVTEVGTMNQFFIVDQPDGKRQLITAPLDGTILPGITRKSVLELTREGTFGDLEVVERKYTIHELIDWIENGQLVESFGSGTAAVVSPVKGFHFEGKDYQIPLDPSDSQSQLGPITKQIYDTITGIQTGRIKHPWSVLV